jgi:hypothetical protein
VTVGIEGEAFQKSLMYWVRERMRAENTFFMIQKILTGGQSKPLRVMGLVPVISNGVLFFKRDQKTLIDQLLAHPFGGMAHDDLKDALAMQLVLWGVTSLTGDSQMEVANNDPFSASVAMTEICNRHKEPRALVDDLFEEFPSLEPALEWVGR